MSPADNTSGGATALNLDCDLVHWTPRARCNAVSPNQSKACANTDWPVARDKPGSTVRACRPKAGRPWSFLTKRKDLRAELVASRWLLVKR